jgi:N-acetylglucosamine-6-sulfatase
VRDVVEELHDRDALSNTLIVFTSDNGMLWGEHRLDGKGVIYEEAARVPFVIRYDALVQSAHRDAHLVLNIDLAPTFADAAGIALASDGVSLVPLLDAGGAIARNAFLIEHLRADDDPIAPTFCAVHTRRSVLARYETREEELYDLSRDPFEMINRAGRRQYRDVQRRLEGDLRSLCRPPPPGFSF